MKPRLLFIGGTPRGLALMKKLTAAKENIVFAFIMPEDEHEPYKPSKEIERLCRKQNIPYSLSRKVNLENVPELLRLKPDAALVCGWRTIIPAELYKNIPYGCVAAHDSLLPKYRGFAPTAWAIINGEKKTGVTLFKIDDQGVDAGDIFDQKAVAIGPFETAEEIYPKIIKATLKLYADFLKKVKSNQLRWKKQNHKQATLAARRTPADGEILWEQPAEKVFNLIRALTPPYPYAWTTYQGQKLLIARASLISKKKTDKEHISGKIVAVKPEGLVVSCGQGMVIINKIINTNGREIKINGAHFSSNSRFQ